MTDFRDYSGELARIADDYVGDNLEVHAGTNCVTFAKIQDGPRENGDPIFPIVIDIAQKSIDFYHRFYGPTANQLSTLYAQSEIDFEVIDRSEKIEIGYYDPCN